MKRSKNVDPLIYKKGLKFDDLLTIVDFLFYGEANMYQDNLDVFLKKTFMKTSRTSMKKITTGENMVRFKENQTSVTSLHVKTYS